jgi:hypothetical protein
LKSSISIAESQHKREIEECQNQVAEVGSWKSNFAQYYFESFIYGIKEISKKDKEIAEKYKEA